MTQPVNSHTSSPVARSGAWRSGSRGSDQPAGERARDQPRPLGHRARRGQGDQGPVVAEQR